jgi:anthranilate phosphoribosyltransferase
MLLSVLDNQAGPARDIVLLNAGAAIYVAGITASLVEGVEKARSILASGAAMKKMQELIAFSNHKSN